jgi:cytochrome c peroxidase
MGMTKRLIPQLLALFTTTTVVVLLMAIVACQPEAPVDPVSLALNLPKTPYNYSNPNVPAHFEAANVINRDNTPFNNAVTDYGATLGRVLFYDKTFSANRSISCASCHHSGLGFGDTAQFSRGFAGGRTGRHSMSLVNARFYANGTFFWDERATSLEQQVLMPFQDPVEMGMTLDSLVARAGRRAYYPPLFEQAFGTSEITTDRISKALAQFVRSIVSYQSRYDVGRAQVAGPAVAFPNFTAQENQGKNLFFGITPGGGPPAPGACIGCHGTEAFTARGPRNNGIDLVSTTDLGVGQITGNPAQNGLFKVPSLRNIAERAPYMRDGRFATLEEVVDHYSTGVQNHPNLSPELRTPNGTPVNPNFSPAQKAALVAFMRTLSDPTLGTDPKFSNPFK